MTDNNDIRQLQERVALYEDMEAYHGLYDLLYNDLERFCFSIIKSHQAAEEIVSDVFMKIWQIRNKLLEVENLKVYAFTIAKNFCLNHIAYYYKKPVESLDEVDIESAITLGNPEELCISSDIINKIHNTIRQLPPQCRLIFQMVKIDGMKYKEVAAILNISVLTVRNQVAIAVHKIAETLPAYVRGKVVNRQS